MNCSINDVAIAVKRSKRSVEIIWPDKPLEAVPANAVETRLAKAFEGGPNVFDEIIEDILRLKGDEPLVELPRPPSKDDLRKLVIIPTASAEPPTDKYAAKVAETMHHSNAIIAVTPNPTASTLELVRRRLADFDKTRVTVFVDDWITSPDWSRILWRHAPGSPRCEWLILEDESIAAKALLDDDIETLIEEWPLIEGWSETAAKDFDKREPEMTRFVSKLRKHFDLPVGDLLVWAEVFSRNAFMNPYGCDGKRIKEIVKRCLLDGAGKLSAEDAETIKNWGVRDGSV